MKCDFGLACRHGHAPRQRNILSSLPHLQAFSASQKRATPRPMRGIQGFRQPTMRLFVSASVSGILPPLLPQTTLPVPAMPDAPPKSRKWPEKCRHPHGTKHEMRSHYRQPSRRLDQALTGGGRTDAREQKTQNQFISSISIFVL